MDTFLKNILMRVEKYCTKNVKDKNMHSELLILRSQIWLELSNFIVILTYETIIYHFICKPAMTIK